MTFTKYLSIEKKNLRFESADQNLVIYYIKNFMGRTQGARLLGVLRMEFLAEYKNPSLNF